MRLTLNRKSFFKGGKSRWMLYFRQESIANLRVYKVNHKGDKCWILSSDERNAIKTCCDVVYADCDMVFCLNKSDIEKYVSLLIDEMFSIEVEPEHNKVTIVI